MSFETVEVQVPADPAPGVAGLAAAAAQLDLEAARVEQGAAAPDGTPPAPIDRAAEAADLVQFATTLVFPLWPSLEKVYTLDVRARLAGAVAPLMEKYNFNLGEFFGKWAPEISFAMVAVPLIAPTVAAIRADRAERNKAPAAPIAPPPASVNVPPAAASTADMLQRAAAGQ